MINHDIAVIGGGPAGMAAAVAAYDSGVTDVCILEREEMLGGILKQCIHNGFGLHKLGRELTGPEYAAVYAEKVKERGIKTYCETMVTGISPDKTVTAQSTAGLLKIKAKAVILAMGCRERSRGALKTAGTRPAGVYSAGTAQKLMNCEGYSVGKKVVILGSGEAQYEQFFHEMRWKYPDRVAFTCGYIPDLAKKIYAGANMFLMPSKSEPCGLAQMISLRYGTIPIVRKTGGLADSIVDCGDENGTGYTFQSYNAHDMLYAVKRAKDCYWNKTEWNKLVTRAMKADFSWKQSAKLYIGLYKELAGEQ